MQLAAEEVLRSVLRVCVAGYSCQRSEQMTGLSTRAVGFKTLTHRRYRDDVLCGLELTHNMINSLQLQRP